MSKSISSLVREEVLASLNPIYPLSRRAEQFLIDNLVRQEFDEKVKLLQEGEVCTTLWFVARGLMWSYEEDGKKWYNWFMKEGDVATSVVSFFKGVPGSETVQTLESCVLYALTKEDLEKGIKKHASLARLTLALQTRYYCQSREMESILRRKRYDLLYDYLLEQQPDLLSRVDIKDIASFMGISRTKFHEIRTARSKKNVRK